MAEAPDLPKTLEEMEQEITCSVCHEHYREPKILPCLHYYCIECLQRLAERVGQPVPCPECRRQAAFPLNDARQLPTPFFVHRMIDFYGRMEKAQGKKEALCESCSGGKAEAFCRHCMEFICAKCAEPHGRMKAFKGHEITSMEQLRVGGAMKIPAPEAPSKKCEAHDEVVKLYCYTCSQLICRDCVIDDHADHDREFVKKAGPRCREKLRESAAPLRQAPAEITAAAADVQAAKREVAENLASVSKTIRQSMDEMIATLQQRKQQLLAKASELAEEKLGALDAQEKSLDMSLAEARSLVDVVERNLQNASDEELLELQQQIATGVEDGCRKRQQVGLQPAAEANIGTDMTFDLQSLLSVGCVGLDVVDTSKCTVEGVDTKAEVNKPVELTLHLVDSTGRPCSSLLSIVAGVKLLVDGSVIPTTIFSVSGGTYRATFTPHIRGRHFATVRVNGREICGSPFSVFVRVPPAQLKEPVRHIDGVNGPWGVAISKDEEVLVAEWGGGGRVSVFDKQGRKLRTIQHDYLPHPIGVATDPDGNIYISNDSSIVVKFNRDGQPLQISDSLGCKLELSRVVGDTLFICSEKCVLLVACEDLHLIRKFGKEGEGNGEFLNPFQVVSVNGELYISDCGNCRLQVFDQEGLKFVRSFEVKNPSTQKLYRPGDICVGPDGLLYVTCEDSEEDSVYSERVNYCIQVMTLSGEYVATFGGVGGGPLGVAVDADGFVYVTLHMGERVFVY